MPPLPAQADFPAIEHEMLARWNRQRTFDASLKQTEGADRWTFYEGPPTANGMPGVHHIEARVFKDVFPRFKTMQGFHVTRKGGWDCHGLPVEVAVEKELGLSGKKDIEAYGVAEFNERCRESVLRHVDAFAALTTRMGYWIDLSTAYRTMDAEYVESVWWALKTIYDKGLLVRDFRISPYCPRCGTALSDHEMGQPDVYKDVADPSVTVRFPITKLPAGANPLLAGADLLVWTTTPWTLVSNTAVAVHPEVEYVVARRSGGLQGTVPAGKERGDGDKVVVANALWPRVLGEGWHVVATVRGAELLGASYQRPFDLVDIPDAHRVVAGTFVTTEDGTGLVHLAPAFGADDLAAIRANAMTVVNPVRADGRFEEDLPMVGGLFFKDADAPLTADLAERGLLFKSERHTHSYPHCWRCNTVLLYYALPSWYIRTTAIKDELLAQNEQTNWQPATIKNGRYGEWLRNNVDWALSRTRYWGTPLPIWSCPSDHVTCVGSLAELGGLAGQDLSGLDPHRPYVDDVLVPVPGVRPARDAGAGGDRRLVRLRVDAVRAVGRAAAEPCLVRAGLPGPVHLRGDRPDPGLVLLADGGGHAGVRAVPVRERGLPRAGHGRVGQEDVQAPRQRHRAHGADERPWGGRGAMVLRRVGVPVGASADRAARARRDRAQGAAHLLEHRVVPGAVRERGRRAGPGDAGGAAWTPEAAASAPPAADRPLLDRWLLSEVHACVRDVTASLEAFDTATAGRRLAGLIDDLSNWYVRRSRRRFWDGPGSADGASAFATLHSALAAVTAMMAPITPFLADYLWGVLRPADAPESVHLATWPTWDDALIDPSLSAQMALARRLVELGRSARSAASVRTRQPLGRALVGAAGFAALPAELRDLIAEELNVHAVEPLDAVGRELVTYTVKPEFRALGKRFGSSTQAVAAAIRAADPAALAHAVTADGSANDSADDAARAGRRWSRCRSWARSR